MIALKKTAYLGVAISAIVLSGCLGGSGGSSDNNSGQPPEVFETEQARRVAQGFFTTDLSPENEEEETKTALPGASLIRGVYFVNEEETQDARYLIEIPDDWEGTLVMWAHGFRGEGQELTVDAPPAELRQWLIANKFAWAASSYSTNFYDVRAGVEDTNALALQFTDLAAAEGIVVNTPSEYLITGVSMGGHVAGAAVERETIETANNRVEYAGAAPFCGVMGDTALFDYFTAYGLALYEIAGVGADSFPVSEEDALPKVQTARANLWTPGLGDPVTPGGTPAYITYMNQVRFTLNDDGQQLFEVLKNLSGGERPIYSSPYAFGQFQDLLQGFAGADGTVTGILNKNVTDTTDTTYRFEFPLTPTLSPAEVSFNNTIVQAIPDAGANDLRDDGLRLIPKINGQFDVPVITAHTLGDLFVPFSMQQIYKQRAQANLSDDLLVQRAIRAPGHCDFTQQEYVNTFSALVNWLETGIKPDGDIVDDPDVVAAADYGCEFTVDGPTASFRGLVGQACPN